MLTVHHLGKSQSERIVWLCEELGIPYELKRYNRDPVTILAPAEYRALHPIGAAPVITDGDLATPASPPISTGSTSPTAPCSRSWGGSPSCAGPARRTTTRRRFS